jgi:hypothetical protein
LSPQAISFNKNNKTTTQQNNDDAQNSNKLIHRIYPQLYSVDNSVKTFCEETLTNWVWESKFNPKTKVKYD